MNRSLTACALVSLVIVFACMIGAAPATKPARDRGKAREIADLKMTFVRIEPGEFLMGSPADEAHRTEAEPQHKVRITKPFYLLATEVSQGQYKAVMGENPSEFKGDELPVESVSWHAAALFCEVLSKREGRRFRLPTEAEWEYAARAGTNGPVSGTGKLAEMAWHADNSGNQPIDSANIWDTDSDNYFARITANGCRPRAVGTGTPNDWGVHDMQGNVSEWVGDWYEKDSFATSPGDDPPGPASSPMESRVIRGGSWGSDPRQCRVASRNWNNPWKQSASRGFRVVMEAADDGGEAVGGEAVKLKQ
jgi:formylglycine-generating enzyme required for sulfatase activity